MKLGNNFTCHHLITYINMRSSYKNTYVQSKGSNTHIAVNVIIAVHEHKKNVHEQ